MRRGSRISTVLRNTPLAVPVPHLAVESALSQGRDDEAALAEGGVGLGVAVPAESDQPIEVEVRAPLGAFGDVMYVETSLDTAGLTDPAGAGQDQGADLLPLFETRRWSA